MRLTLRVARLSSRHSIVALGVKLYSLHTRHRAR